MNKYSEEKKFTRDGNTVKNIIKNGTTTIVYGMVKPDRNLEVSLGNKLSKAYGLASAKVESVKGVSKCQSGDNYSESVGVTVASRKAEVKARRKYIASLEKAEKLLAEALAEVRNERENTAKRVAKVSEELKKF